MRKSIFYVILAVLISCSPSAQEPSITRSNLWVSGQGGYNNYRIPSIIVTTKGTVLAFCEGREGGDSGDIDLLMKRSEDQGITWSEEQIIWDDGDNSCGNPCPVVDKKTGRIWLFMTWNYGKDHESQIIQKKSKNGRLPYLCYSDDDGITWSTPRDMSYSCRDSSWGWYATGPGIGIQLKTGKHKGRLVIPANHSYDDPNGTLSNGPFGYGSHVLYSDDHGESWRMSQSISPGCNESQVTELSDASLLMNMRSYNGLSSRAISKSSDGGATWSEITHDYQLVESKCQASILNYGLYEEEQLHFFLNPAVPQGRTHLTLRVSKDDCKTWSNSKLIYPGPSAYSCLTMLPGGNIGLFFEAGAEHSYEKMVFISGSPEELFSNGEILTSDSI